MARTAKDYKLDSKSARLKLDARAKPYNRQLAPRKTLGYIRRESGPGPWIVSELIGGKRKTRIIGYADDLETADGKDILTYEQAQTKAGQTAVAETAPRAKSITVKQAVEDYLAALAGRSKHSEETRQRSEKHIIPTLGGYEVRRLTKKQIETWRDNMVREDTEEDADARRRSQDSANRILTILKAALNHAFSDDANHIPTDSAWRRVKAFKDVAAAREDHFDPAQVRKLIAEAAKFDKSLAHLCEAGYLTGARYGELAALNVRHFDAASALLLIPDGKTGARPVTLGAEAVAFFRGLTIDRPPAAVLLPRADGDRWGKSEQHRPFKRAAAAAKLPPSASFYTLRHSHISRAIDSLMPLSLIAENCGTSLTMIQKNYSHVLAKTRRKTINATTPRLRRVK